MVSMATCIERGARLEMKISYDWTVRSIKRNSKNEGEVFLKNEVLQLKPHNKICGCYYNLTVMWLRNTIKVKRNVTLMQVKENSTQKATESDTRQHSQVERQSSLLSRPQKLTQILIVLLLSTILVTWFSKEQPQNILWWLLLTWENWRSTSTSKWRLTLNKDIAVVLKKELGIVEFSCLPAFSPTIHNSHNIKRFHYI